MCREVRNIEMKAMHRLRLIVFPYVVPRSAVASAEIDLIGVPRDVASRQICKDLSDAPGHVSLRRSYTQRSY